MALKFRRPADVHIFTYRKYERDGKGIQEKVDGSYRK
jgi:hypothetical protein